MKVFMLKIRLQSDGCNSLFDIPDILRDVAENIDLDGITTDEITNPKDDGEKIGEWMLI